MFFPFQKHRSENYSPKIETKKLLRYDFSPGSSHFGLQPVHILQRWPTNDHPARMPWHGNGLRKKPSEQTPNDAEKTAQRNKNKPPEITIVSVTVDHSLQPLNELQNNQETSTAHGFLEHMFLNTFFLKSCFSLRPLSDLHLRDR